MARDQQVAVVQGTPQRRSSSKKKTEKEKEEISPQTSLLSGLKWKPASSFKKSLPKRTTSKKRAKTPIDSETKAVNGHKERKATKGTKEKRTTKDASATEKGTEERRSRSRSQKQAPAPAAPQVPLIETKKGPRCRKQDSAVMYAVTAILKKWVGPTDRSKRDVFYLIHFTGQPAPPLRAAHESLWQHASQMRSCDQMIAEFEEKWQAEQDALRSKQTSNSKFYYYAESGDEDEEEEEADSVIDEFKLAAESSDVNGRLLRKRSHAGGGGSGGSDSQALIAIQSYGSSGGGQEKTAPAEKKVGFDRGLEPEEILSCSFLSKKNSQLMYVVKWRGSKVADFVVSSLCHTRCPDLVLDYLISKLTNVPTITSSQLRNLEHHDDYQS